MSFQAVPGPHRRSQLYRHLPRWNQTVDRRARQHRALLGFEGGTAAPATRLYLTGRGTDLSRRPRSVSCMIPGCKTDDVVADLLAGLLSHWRVAGCGHGEQQRGGASPHQARQVSAAPA